MRETKWLAIQRFNCSTDLLLLRFGFEELIESVVDEILSFVGRGGLVGARSWCVGAGTGATQNIAHIFDDAAVFAADTADDAAYAFKGGTGEDRLFDVRLGIADGSAHCEEIGKFSISGVGGRVGRHEAKIFSDRPAE